MRVQVVGGSNTVYYLQTDHLGSTTALSSLAVGGGLVSGSTARYLPFGGWRTTPTQTLTDRGYTGHLENMELGLIYMNARYYVPAIGRFASADTIVPNPAEPQSFNRYSYTLNNPLRYTDPTGHATECGASRGGGCGGAVNPLQQVKMLKESGAIDDPARSETIEIPIAADGELLGRVYIPPVDSPQSTVSEDTFRYKAGRGLAALGVGLDVIELILSPVPTAGVFPAQFDVFVTYLSGVFTGDNYSTLWGTHPPGDLPLMRFSVNQDFAVNLVEWGLPTAIGAVGTAAGVTVGAASPIPGDEFIYGGIGAMIYSMTDAITSGASAIYDAGRYQGVFHNHFTVGYSPEYGVVVVIWPHK